MASHRQGSNGSSREGDRAGAGGVLCSGRPHLHCLPVSVSLTHTDTLHIKWDPGNNLHTRPRLLHPVHMHTQPWAYTPVCIQSCTGGSFGPVPPAATSLANPPVPRACVVYTAREALVSSSPSDTWPRFSLHPGGGQERGQLWPASGRSCVRGRGPGPQLPRSGGHHTGHSSLPEIAIPVPEAEPRASNGVVKTNTGLSQF